MYTPNQFKLFVENATRDQVYTYPFTTDTTCSDVENSIALGRTSIESIKMLVILVLAIKDVPVLEPPTEESESLAATPVNRSKEASLQVSEFKEKPKSEESTSTPTPKIVRGFKEGKPVYSQIRVLPQKFVDSLLPDIEELVSDF